MNAMPKGQKAPIFASSTESDRTVLIHHIFDLKINQKRPFNLLEENMPIHKSTEFGEIEISLDAIANLVGGTINECYGIIGMASQKILKDGWAELLKRDNYSRGVIVRQDGNSLILDIYVIAMQGIKLSEVMMAAQQRISYVVEKTLEVKVEAVNLYVQGVRSVK